MDDCLPSPKTPSTLRRSHSIPTSVVVSSRADSNPDAALGLPPALLDLDFVSVKSPFSYTSLRDVLPSPAAAVNSPTTSSAASGSSYHISIRNRLVKQAAWAYLQPMSASPQSSSGPNILCRLSFRFSSCFRFVLRRLVPGATRIFYRILRAIRRHVSIYGMHRIYFSFSQFLVSIACLLIFMVSKITNESKDTRINHEEDRLKKRELSPVMELYT